MLSWEKLLSSKRRKPRGREEESSSRTPFERDYDRILFATPTRRLVDKTQVFPMEQHDSIRNRLTHSHEVSNLARSIGVRLAFVHADRVFGPVGDSLQVKRNVPAVLAAAGLAHDLGNPPFGHQGEASIQRWFRKKAGNLTLSEDFLDFDGNAQTVRLLTKLQLLNDSFGLDLASGTLASIIKYPTVYGSQCKAGFSKHGIFRSEEDVVEKVWRETGLSSGVRHPLAYVMEACDDIAYSIIDAEDTVKKGYASYYDLVEFLRANACDDKIVRRVLEKTQKKHDEFRKEKLSSRELSDISMQMFRVYAIRELVDSATDAFVQNIDRILAGDIDAGFELIKVSPSRILCSRCKEFDKRYGFQHADVIRQELIGHNHLVEMMDFLWEAIAEGEFSESPFNRFIYGQISENYRRIYESSRKDEYAKCQLLCDAVSGMTESFLLKKCDEFRALNP